MNLHIHIHDRRRYAKLFIPMSLLSLGMVILGFLIDPPMVVIQGLKTIFFSSSLLITDYMALAGVGAALANSGLVCLFSLAILYYSKDPVNGFTLVTLGLMAGFSLFGKNLLNSFPIFLGTFLFSKLKQEPFSRYASVSLLATALSPMVSFVAFHDEHPMPILGLILGLLIGFVMPSLAAYTFRIQNGMNLYNAGFACGVLGMVLAPVLSSLGHAPEPELYWFTGYNLYFDIALSVFCLSLILYGTIRGKKEAWHRYLHLLRTSGRLPSDYLRTYGTPAVCINMGINGLLCGAYILLVGGDLNGPTLGGIFTVMGFSAYGKHAANIAPVIAGVAIGNIFNNVPLDNPSMQIAGLFGTTLAPISGVFGWPFGLLAGFLHSAVVLYCGGPLGGVNLYNNGFSGGIIAIVLYPILTALLFHRKPNLQDEEFYDIFEEDSPLTEEEMEEHHHPEEAQMPH